MSLKEIGNKLDLTRERIRQIRRDSLTTLYEYIQDTGAEYQQDETEGVDVIFDLADDVEYEEMTTFLAALKELHIAVAGKSPRLNYINVKRWSKEQTAVLGRCLK